MASRWRGIPLTMAVGALSALLLLAGCQPEQRPGTVKSIGGKTGSASASASVSAVPEAETKAGASEGAAETAARVTKGDGIYTPVSNVDIYQLISLDVAEIGKLTNAINEDKPLPSEEIFKIYEKGKYAKIGDSDKPLRQFATDPGRAKEFADAAEYFKSETFLDDPVIAAINGTGVAANYSSAQRRQAINKGLLRILRYYSLHELNGAESKLKAGNVDPEKGAPHNVDEAWAIYVGAEKDGRYPFSLAATAQSREGNFKREGTVDKPLREAFERAKRASLERNLEAFEAAEKDIYSRMNSLFYLASARYLNEALESAKDGKAEKAAADLIEGFAFYQTIQPVVATVDASADQTLVEYYRSNPAKLNAERRDAALAGLNKAADALLLKQGDLLTPADFE